MTGSGLGALKEILERKPNLFSAGEAPGGDNTSASRIYSYVRYGPWLCPKLLIQTCSVNITFPPCRTYLVTHAHLDHVMGLILLAGGIGGSRKSIRGSRQTLEDLETIFRPSRIWPNLASWEAKDSDHLYLYEP